MFRKTMSLILMLFLIASTTMSITKEVALQAHVIADAKRNTNLQGIFPTQRLLGKSPEYVSVYFNNYKNEVEQKQGKITASRCLEGCIFASIIGCAVAGLIILNYDWDLY